MDRTEAGEHILITRYGSESVVFMSLDDFRRLKAKADRSADHATTIQ